MHPEGYGILCGHLLVERAGICPNGIRVLYSVTSDKTACCQRRQQKDGSALPWVRNIGMWKAVAFCHLLQTSGFFW